MKNREILTVELMVAIRSLLGLKQSELAELLGYSQVTIAKIECNDTTISPKFARNFFMTLNLTDEEIQMIKQTQRMLAKKLA